MTNEYDEDVDFYDDYTETEAPAPENKPIIIQLTGGERDSASTRYGTFSKGVSVEVNRSMADELLQITDSKGEKIFTEL